MAAVFGDIVRIMAGTQKRPKVAEKKAADQAAKNAENEIALAEAKAVPPAPPTSVPSSSVKKDRIVKLSQVLSQTAKQEITILDEKTLGDAYKRYFDVFNVLLPQNAELAVEQLTGLHSLLFVPSKPVPYVDFAIWCPMWHRSEKKSKLTEMSFDPSGQLKQVEILGSPTFEIWEECHECLKTGLVMFDAVSLGWIDLYHAKQQKYHRRYGAQVWHVQYQAEVKMRREAMERTCRRGELEHPPAIAAGNTQEYEPDHPWQSLWKQAVEHSDKFWKEELQDQALMTLTRATDLKSVVNEDARIEGGFATSHVAQLGGGKRRRSPAPPKREPKRKAQRNGDTMWMPGGTHTTVQDSRYALTSLMDPAQLYMATYAARAAA